MREEFEKLPEIADSLSEHIYFGGDNLYHSALINFQGLVNWLNGAWYAFQEQQKKIDVGKELQVLYRKEVKQLECGVGKAILSIYDGDEENALCILKELPK